MSYTFNDYQNGKSPNVTAQDFFEKMKKAYISQTLLCLTNQMRDRPQEEELCVDLEVDTDIDESVFVDVVSELKSMGFNASYEHDPDEHDYRFCIVIDLS